MGLVTRWVRLVTGWGGTRGVLQFNCLTGYVRADKKFGLDPLRGVSRTQDGQITNNCKTLAIEAAIESIL